MNGARVEGQNVLEAVDGQLRDGRTSSTGCFGGAGRGLSTTGEAVMSHLDFCGGRRWARVYRYAEFDLRMTEL